MRSRCPATKSSLHSQQLEKARMQHRRLSAAKIKIFFFLKDNTPWPCRFILETQGWFNIWKAANIISHINKLRKKSHLVISVAEKALDKIHHSLITKTLSKPGVEGNFLNLIKGINNNKKI